MKAVVGVLLVAVLALNGVLSLPANDDAEVIATRRRFPFSSIFEESEETPSDPDFKDFTGVIDTGAYHPFLQPSPPSFGFNVGIFDSFDNIFRNIRKHFSSEAGGIDSDSSDGGFKINIDTNKGNTTSTVEVINGHKVEVNETVYGDENTHFKVRMVNIRPLQSDEDENAEKSVITNGSPVTSAPPKIPIENKPIESENDSDERREPLEKQSKDNEIGNVDDPEHTTTEDFIETTTMLPTLNEDEANLNAEFVTENTLAEEFGVPAEETAVENFSNLRNAENHKASEMNSGDDDDDEEGLKESAEVQHLNKEMSELELSEEMNAALEAKDKEELEDMKNYEKERENEFSSDDENDAGVIMNSEFNSEWSELAEDLAKMNDKNNDLENEIDVYESALPLDLSNDIAVNDIAAANGDFLLNPDAELIDVMNPSSLAAMPKFEKISMINPTSYQDQSSDAAETTSHAMK